MAQTPGPDGEQHSGRFQRAPRHQWRRGLLVPDEVKTNLATFIQDAFRSLLGVLFYVGPSVTHEVLIYGREHVTDWHPKLIVSNHKQDMDSIVMLGAIYYARGVTRPNRLLAFALREDAYWAGFLARVLSWPWPLNVALRAMRISGPLWFLKAHPMGMLRSRLDQRRTQRQLESLIEVLDRGFDLYWTPEGGLSKDGHLARFRAGLHRLLHATSASVRILPVGITYDFMTVVRTRCFIRIGHEFEPELAWTRGELQDRTRQEMLRLWTVNIGHLMAAVLRAWPEGVPLPQDLDGRLSAEAARLHALGLALDRRLTSHRSLRRRLRMFLAYAERNQILCRDGSGWQVRQGIQHAQMRYARNELEDMEHALARPVLVP